MIPDHTTQDIHNTWNSNKCKGMLDTTWKLCFFFLLFIKLEVQLFSAIVLRHIFMCFSKEHAWNSMQDLTLIGH